LNFELPPRLTELRAQVRSFIDERVIPSEKAIVEEDAASDRVTGGRPTLKKLQAEVQAAGLWTPHLPVEHGGLGLGPIGMATLFREMGRSFVGPRSFHCDAPDQGNMDLLIRAASPAIIERWLAPLVRGEITSAFSMTEPAPGAGADPTNLRTTARPAGDGKGGFIIDGHKWFATGAGEAAFIILMARTSDDRRGGATLFVIDRHAEGIEHVRDVGVMAEPLLAHREAELLLKGVYAPAESVLGEVGQGFALAQARLVPARLTHCMRWLGLADRALHLCKDYLTRRISFGRPLADHQMVQAKIADGVLALHAGNLMTFHCAWMLEQGLDKEARPYSSMAKIHVANLLCDILDDAIQLHGAAGYSDDLPFADWYRHARGGRIADGPDEVHRMVIARDFFKERFATLV
jgi:acyl-CoA dehydrogenase